MVLFRENLSIKPYLKISPKNIALKWTLNNNARDGTTKSKARKLGTLVSGEIIDVVELKCCILVE